MIWQELATALCLVLVIEGIVPFLYPQRWREMTKSLMQLDDRILRGLGLASMLLGTGLLYLVN